MVMAKVETNKERKLRERAERDAARAANPAVNPVSPANLLGKPAATPPAPPATPPATPPAATTETKTDAKAEAKVDAKPAEAKPEVPADVVVTDEMKGNDLYPVVAAMPETTPEEKASKQKMLRTLASLMSTAKISADKSKFAAFDKELRETLPGFVKALETKHGVVVEGRKLIVAFPKGKPIDLTNVPIGTKKQGGGGGKGVGTKTFTNLQGEKQDYISVLYTAPDGRTETFDSLNAFAKDKGFKYEGRANATVVVTDPWKPEKDAAGNYPKFPYQHSIVRDEKKVLQIRRIARPS